MEQRDIADAIYAAAFGTAFVQAMAAGESFPHDKAEMRASAAKAAYYRVVDARAAILDAR